MALKHLVAAFALGAAVSAQAQVGPIGNGGDAGLLDDNFASFLDVVQGNQVPILGVFGFSLGTLSNVIGGFADFPVEGAAVGAVGSSLTSLLVFDVANTVAPVLGDVTPEDGLGVLGQLAAGNYVILVTGATIGTDGGAYAGLLAASTVPIPEVGTSAMMSLGLVGLFLAARRRRSQG